MAQVFRVVSCYQCKMYQVDQIKKIKKWQCKLCGEKQSVLKEYGTGTGRDCRLHVQKLNAKRIDNDRLEMEVLERICDDDILRENHFEVGSSNIPVQNPTQASKLVTVTERSLAEEENQNKEEENIDITRFDVFTTSNKKNEKYKPLKRLVKIPEIKLSKNVIPSPRNLSNFTLTENINDDAQQKCSSPQTPIEITESHEGSKSKWNTSLAEYQETSSDDDLYFDKIPEFV